MLFYFNIFRGTVKRNQLVFVTLFAHWKRILSMNILIFIATIVLFMIPILIGLMVDFLKSEEPFWKGLIYSTMLFFVPFTITLVIQRYIISELRLAQNVSLIFLIFRLRFHFKVFCLEKC